MLINNNISVFFLIFIFQRSSITLKLTLFFNFELKYLKINFENNNNNNNSNNNNYNNNNNKNSCKNNIEDSIYDKNNENFLFSTQKEGD